MRPVHSPVNEERSVVAVLRRVVSIFWGEYSALGIFCLVAQGKFVARF